MKDYKSIKLTKNGRNLEITNPKNLPLAGTSAQSAVFKLGEEKCVKVYLDPEEAKREAKALRGAQALTFLPRIYQSGSSYVIMEFYQGQPLADYLKNCTYMPETIARNLLDMLLKIKAAELTPVDLQLKDVFVFENEELKLAGFVHPSFGSYPVPFKLLADLKSILLKDSFLAQVEKLEPGTYQDWENFLTATEVDYKNIIVSPGGTGEGVKIENASPQALVGSGHQGAVYRISEDQCVKIYGRRKHAKREQKVLLSNQDLSFIPKVYETGDNYVVMEYLQGPDLNTFLKKQSALSEDVTRRLLEILTAMKQAGFKQIDAPLRHIIVTNKGFKLVDHVYSYTKVQKRPIELFLNLRERNFLDTFLSQVKELDRKTYKEWTKTAIPDSKTEKAKEDSGKHKRKHHSKNHDLDKDRGHHHHRRNRGRRR